jgi:hypothetical protein
MTKETSNRPITRGHESSFQDLGRPVEVAWMRRFTSCLGAMLPQDRNYQLRTRSKPGVTYIMWQKLEGMSYRKEGFIERGADTGQVIGKLLTGKVLDEAMATKWLTVHLRGLSSSEIGVSKDGLAIQQLHATVADYRTNVYSGGHVIAGEQAAIWEAMLPGTEQPANMTEKGPQYDITLGTIAIEEFSLDQRFMDLLEKRLFGYMRLGPLDDLAPRRNPSR